MTTSHTDRAHALLSASGASRWIACNRSARLEEDFQEETSFYADEGTLAHEFAELMLRKARGIVSLGDYRKASNKLKKNELYTEDMPNHARKYVDYVLQQFNVASKKAGPVTLLIEEKVSLEEYIEEGFGTCDANVIADGILEIIDLKYGKGIRVDAGGNSQLRFYALGALAKYELAYDITKVRYTVVQPRLDHISSEMMSADDLIRWGNAVVRPAAKKAYAGEGSHVSGGHCRWCKAAPRCKVLAEASMATAQHDFCEPGLLTDEELIKVYEAKDNLVSWANGVAKYLLDEALKGKKWEGYKLVEGRSTRAWKALAKAEKVMQCSYVDKQLYNTKIKGFGDLEKLMTKPGFAALVGEFVHKPAGKPTLVIQADKRPELNSLDQANKDFN